jgi:hypothetical protein
MTTTDLTTEQTDILRLLSAKVHLGAEKINYAMKKYVEQKNSSGNYIFNLSETYNKIKLAARIIASIKNLSEVIVSIVLCRSYAPKIRDSEPSTNSASTLVPLLPPPAVGFQVLSPIKPPRSSKNQDWLLLRIPSATNRPLSKPAMLAFPPLLYATPTHHSTSLM